VQFWFAQVVEPNDAEDIAHGKVKHWQVPHAVVLMQYKQALVTSCILSCLARTLTMRV